MVSTSPLDTTVRIWDAKAAAAIGKPMKGHTLGVWCVAYSPDGKHIISGSADTTIQIWDVETGAAISKPLMGHSHLVQSVGFSPDGRHITSGSNDGAIHVWESGPHTPVELFSSGNQVHPNLYGRPDSDGWVKDLEGGLLY